MQAEVGIGVTGSILAKGGFEIHSVVPGGAADASGNVLVDDVIVAVDGVTLVSYAQAKKLLLGAPGTSLKVELLRKQEPVTSP